MRVHVVGAGKMGLPMARKLRDGGHALSVSDPDAGRLRLARDAALQTLTAAEGIAAADVILSSLPHDAALLAVGEEVARHARRGAVYIDTSTVSQALRRRLRSGAPGQACGTCAPPSPATITWRRPRS
jgi:3-hydroxyisobutyrate dehydrogenase